MKTCNIPSRLLACACLIIGLVCGGIATAAENNQRPNIVLIVADDLPSNLVNFLPDGKGKSLTPNLDELAAEGIVMTNMHSPSPVCTPSRYAVLTGNYPSRAKNHEFVRDTKRFGGQTAVGFNTHIRPEDNNLVKRMQAAGYTTGAVGKNHVFEIHDFNRLPYLSKLDDPGVADKLEQNREAVTRAFKSVGFDYTASLYFGNPDADGIKPLAGHNHDWITQGALNFLDQHHDEPLFMYMATTLPHGPFAPERSYKADRRLTPYGLLDEPLELLPNADSIDKRLKQAKANQWNAANVLWLDDSIGVIMDKLETLGIKDNTIVIFCSDHGTKSKGACYAEGTRTVSLMWKADGFEVGNKTDAALSLIDVAPTVLSLAGVEYQPDEMDGKNMVGVLNGTQEKLHDYLYFEMGFTRAVQKDGLKYLAVRYPPFAVDMPREERQRRLDKQTEELTARGRPIPTDDPMAPFSHLTLVPGGADAEQVSVRNHPAYFDKDQLYVHADDPKEQVNRVDDPSLQNEFAELKSLLDKHLEQMPGTFGEAKSNSTSQ